MPRQSLFRTRSELHLGRSEWTVSSGLAVSQLTYVIRGLIRLSAADPHLGRRNFFADLFNDRAAFFQKVRDRSCPRGSFVYAKKPLG
jgi:CRP-like cAMP-binding protein